MFEATKLIFAWFQYISKTVPLLNAFTNKKLVFNIKSTLWFLEPIMFSFDLVYRSKLSLETGRQVRDTNRGNNSTKSNPFDIENVRLEVI